MKLLLLAFFSIFCLRLSAQWAEMNAPGLNQPYNNIPLTNLPVSFTLGNTVYYGTGSTEFDITPDIYNSDFYEYNILTGMWQPAPQISNGFSARKNASAFTHNGKAYVGFGEDDSNEFNDLWEIDVQSGAITQKASMPGPRSLALSFVSGSKAYAGGGYVSGTVQNDFYNYSFANNTWASENTLTPSTDRFILQIDGQGYLFSYRDSANNLTRSLSRFDTLSHSWIPCAPYPGNSTSWLKCFAIGDQGFMGFGVDTAFNHLSEFYQYDALNDMWIQKNSYSNIISYDYNSYSNGIKAGFILSNGNTFEYDVVTDSWQEKVGVPFHIRGGKLVVLNNKAYGWNYIYDIASDTWMYDSTLTMDWQFAINGIGYGFYNGVFSMYDPTLPVWPPASVTAPPTGMQTFFSIGNKGYAGDFNTDPTNGFWEFDPLTQVWTRKADFTGPKRDCQGGFSIGNNGYITGGWCDSIGWYIYDFWQYNPQTDAWTRKADGPTGFLGFFMQGDATRGYVGCGIWDAVGSDNGDVSVYNPFTDAWSPLPGLTPRHGTYSFIANDNLYVGGGATRYSQLDYVAHSDLFRMNLAGINTTNEIAYQSTFDIYPNPSKGKISIKNLNSETVSIFDMKGERLFTFSVKKGELSIDLHDKLSPGCYFISTDLQSTFRSRKIIILPE